MWLQAVSAAQVHYELGEDSSARLTHREIIDMVCHELRRVSTRVSSVAKAAQHLDHSIRANNEATREFRADIQGFQQVFELEISRIRELTRGVDEALAALKLESERQSAALTRHLDTCREVQRVGRPRSARIRSMAAKLNKGIRPRNRRKIS